MLQAWEKTDNRDTIKRLEDRVVHYQRVQTPVIISHIKVLDSGNKVRILAKVLDKDRYLPLAKAYEAKKLGQVSAENSFHQKLSLTVSIVDKARLYDFKLS